MAFILPYLITIQFVAYQLYYIDHSLSPINILDVIWICKNSIFLIAAIGGLSETSAEALKTAALLHRIIVRGVPKSVEKQVGMDYLLTINNCTHPIFALLFSCSTSPNKCI